TGALIVNVISDGPAKGILKQGDIVLEFDGKIIKNASALPVVVGSSALDEDLDIKVRRGGETEILKIRLAELPSEDQVNQPSEKLEMPKTNDLLLGMELVDLDDETRESLDVKKGVLVKSIKGDPAKSAGIEIGDLIMMFKGQHIEDLSELKKLGEGIEEGKTYAILILRAGSARFLALKAGK
ncbi:MAG: PDZ domain-containing protein, partial [Cocleimonas sp.]